MKINFQEYLRNHGNIVEWAILRMMTIRDKNFKLPEWKMKQDGGPLDTENMDVTLTINGVEVNFVECIEEINRQNERMVADKAKELVNEQFSDLYEKSQNLTNLMDELIENKKKELGWIE